MVQLQTSQVALNGVVTDFEKTKADVNASISQLATKCQALDQAVPELREKLETAVATITVRTCLLAYACGYARVRTPLHPFQLPYEGPPPPPERACGCHSVAAALHSGPPRRSRLVGAVMLTGWCATADVPGESERGAGLTGLVVALGPEHVATRALACGADSAAADGHGRPRFEGALWRTRFGSSCQCAKCQCSMIWVPSLLHLSACSA